jgi:hypothetical protein
MAVNVERRPKMDNTGKREFHAVLKQVEPSLFRATYRADLNPEQAASATELQGPQILTDMHIGTDAISVKTWVEQLALSRGFDKVVWDELPEG